MSDIKGPMGMIAFKAVVNAMADHYANSQSQLTREEYWKKHLSLTPFQSVDSHIQDLINPLVHTGLGKVDDVVSAVLRTIGLR